MKTHEIIGYKRANLGKSESKRLRAEGNVPCVLYGGEHQIHFYAPMILFKDLVYTSEIHFVELNIEGDIYKCILQDIQFHPVSEVILHADFLLLRNDRLIKMNVPIKLHGNAPGVIKGGKIVMKLRYLTIKALPDNMPEYLDVDISKLELGKSIKVGEMEPKDYQILNSELVSIVSVEVPRAMRGKTEEEEDEEAEA